MLSLVPTEINLAREYSGMTAKLYSGKLEETQQQVSVVKVEISSTEKLISFIDFSKNLVTFNPMIINCLG